MSLVQSGVRGDLVPGGQESDHRRPYVPLQGGDLQRNLSESAFFQECSQEHRKSRNAF